MGWPAIRISYENGDGADGSFEHPEAHSLVFSRQSDLSDNFSDAKLYAIENDPIITYFLKVHHKAETEWISLKISLNITSHLGDIKFHWTLFHIWKSCHVKMRQVWQKTDMLFRISCVNFYGHLVTSLCITYKQTHWEGWPSQMLCNFFSGI